jgi:antitoxin (DNA-binding transcriptional repressor) of toxin-antitoxin stability system
MDDRHRIEPDEPLDALLDRVERGEEVVISRDGRPVARLIASPPALNRTEAVQAVERIARPRSAKQRAHLGLLPAPSAMYPIPICCGGGRRRCVFGVDGRTAGALRGAGGHRLRSSRDR